jgi:hypothetical protein
MVYKMPKGGKVLGTVAGGVAGSAFGPMGTVAGAAIGNTLGGGMPSINSALKGNITGKTKADSADPPKAPENWWREGMPGDRSSIMKDGGMDDRYKMVASQINAPQSRIGELDSRLSGVGQSNFNNVGNTGALAGMGLLTARALDPGQSMYAKSQNQLVDRQTRNAVAKNNMQGAGAFAGARSNLAASGGMDGGARERLASSFNKNQMANNAASFNQGNMAKNEIAATDYLGKMQLQERLPQMYMQYGEGQMANDQFNANLGINKVNMWKGQAGSEDDRTMDASKFNATAQMDTDQKNKMNMVRDNDLGNDYAMDKWKTINAARGGEFTADSQNYYAKQQAKKGLLGNNGGILGLGIGF